MKIQNERQAQSTRIENYLKGSHFASRSKRQQAVHKELYGLVQLSSELELPSAHVKFYRMSHNAAFQDPASDKGWTATAVFSFK